MITKYKYLIVGLGNPDTKHTETRHNIGYQVVQNFIKKNNVTITRIKQISDYALIEYDEVGLIAALPLTYMNLSGIAAKFLIKKYNISVKNLIVVVDEYNFPISKVNLKYGGSSGGHNGIASIIEELETTEFYRLRCGIERNFGKNEMANYVLSPFNTEEKENVTLMVNKAIKAIEYFITNDPPKAFSYINSNTFL